MSRLKTTTEPCGCQWVIEPNGRESWSELCAAHGAEHKALHESAQRQHTEERRMRELEIEFT